MGLGNFIISQIVAVPVAWAFWMITPSIPIKDFPAIPVTIIVWGFVTIAILFGLKNKNPRFKTNPKP